MNQPSTPIGSPKNRSPRSQSSLEAQLDRQLKYLRNSSNLFDSGDHDEANRLATVLRVLTHDTTNSTSLLTLLNIKESLRFVDTGLYRDRLDDAMTKWLERTRPGISIAGIRPGEAGLVDEVGINTDGRPGWRAPLRELRFHPNDPKSTALLPPQKFQAWWETPLVEDSNLQAFSRKNLVLIMANQDGGAHVDESLDRDYADLCVDYLGVQIEFGGPDRTMDSTWNPPPVANNVAFASVRQIAFEMELTLHRYILELRKTETGDV